MKENIAKIAGEHITIEGNGDYEKATRLIQEKGIIIPALIAEAGIPKDIFFKQGIEILGL